MRGFIRGFVVVLGCTTMCGVHAGDVVLDNFTTGVTGDDTALTPDVTDTFQITQGLGRLSGNGANLFHSFDSFSIDAGETARFSGAASIQNIISRVTGGELSTIDGTLASAIDGAGFWFVNPAGVLLGANAAIDVSGTVALGAVDFIRFSDGSLVSLATPEADFALLVASPESFGFVQDSVAGDLTLSDFELVEVDTSLAPPTTVGIGDVILAGGAVTVERSIVQTFGSGPSLTAGDVIITSNGAVFLTDGTTIASGSDAGDPGAMPGDIVVSAAGHLSIDPGTSGTLSQIRLDSRRADGNTPRQVTLAAGSIELTGLGLAEGSPVINLTTSNDAVSGDLVLVADTSIQLTEAVVSNQIESPADAGIAGGISFDAGTDIDIANSTVRGLSSSNVVPTDVASIDIQAGGLLRLAGAGIISSTFGMSDAGDIALRGNVTEVFGSPLGAPDPDNSTSIQSASFGAGSAGDVVIEGNTRVSFNVAPDGSPIFDAGGIFIDSSSSTFTGTSPDDLGAAGDVLVRGGDVTIANALIVANTDSNRADNPLGSISFEADGTLALIGTSVSTLAAGTSNAGGIGLTATTITLDDVAVESSTIASGSAGSVTLNATGAVVSNANAVGASVSLSSSAVNGDPALLGAAGSVEITAGSVNLTDTTMVALTLSNRADNAPAAVSVFADTGITLTRTILTTQTSGATPGGAVTLEGTTVDMNDGVVLESSTESTGAAGSVFVRGTERVTTNASGPGFVGINSSSLGDPSVLGAAGNIILIAGDLSLDGTVIGAATQSNLAGNTPGSISLGAEREISITNTTVSSTTFGAADAGAINLLANNVNLRNNVVIESSTTGAGSAAGITITGVDGVRANFDDNGPVEATAVFISSSAVFNDPNVLGSAGNIVLQGGSVEVANSTLVALTQSSRLDNTAGTISLFAIDDLTVFGTTISTFASGDTPAGTVLLDSARLSLGAGVNVTSSTSGNGAAGGVLVSGRESIALEGSQIRAETLGPGVAGLIALLSDGDIGVTNGALIQTSTAGSGAAGNIVFLTPGAVTISGESTTIASTTSADAAGGGIFFGLGDISAGSLSISDGARLTADASGTGDGGDITIFLAEALNMDRGEITASATSDTANGGSINLLIDSGIVRRNSVIQTTAAGTGNGGVINIGITGEDQIFLVDTTSLISAASAGGTSGTVNISAPDPDIDSAIKPQDVSIVADPVLAADMCSPVRRGQQSSFVVMNQGGVAQSPDGFLSAGLVIPPAQVGGLPREIDAASLAGIDSRSLTLAAVNCP